MSQGLISLLSKIILGLENGMNFAINLRQLLFLLFANFMQMLRNITIGKYLLEESGLVLVEERSTNFSKSLILIRMGIMLLLGSKLIIRKYCRGLLYQVPNGK